MFDSGIGGFTVLRSLLSIAPDVDVIYFGDTANAPYANRDRRTLEWLTLEAFRFLKSQHASLLVSACNSVSASVVRPMLDLFDAENARVIEMVGPTAQYVRSFHPKKVVVIATPATVASGMYQKEFDDCVAISCPHLSGLIEHGESDKKIAHSITNIAAQIAQHKPDLVVLGCTHYPLVKDVISEHLVALGCDALIIDPADVVAATVAQEYGYTGSGSLTLFTSSSSPVFKRVAGELFGKDVRQVVTQPSEIKNPCVV